MPKNCHSCAHLEWVDGESESDSGWDCNKRHIQMSRKDEIVLLEQLDNDAYRNRYKRCFEQVVSKS